VMVMALTPTSPVPALGLIKTSCWDLAPLCKVIGVHLLGDLHASSICRRTRKMGETSGRSTIRKGGWNTPPWAGLEFDQEVKSHHPNVKVNVLPPIVPVPVPLVPVETN
jgi:hypothetical protein